ncbi:hypothetical protein EPA93_24845 [Ktedonosporobacter rubrisoli]|uniref:Uncharacterized protein n=1 Tax=Ktedonosporobacter rubrisoli TaxID=2509675 RepID=A0A4P6JVN8_KTERU|nr:hypothetical protein [Ktedonosporobacter rubrisoli]QBD79036.1 hypothetical protein EPA93_24845 [Ktedonosporobacter rubrisoli]
MVYNVAADSSLAKQGVHSRQAFPAFPDGLAGKVRRKRHLDINQSQAVVPDTTHLDERQLVRE